MNRKEANKEAKKIYDKWKKDKEAIEEKAKKEGIWQTKGLDSNNHLFKEVDKEAKKKIQLLETMIDEE